VWLTGVDHRRFNHRAVPEAFQKSLPIHRESMTKTLLFCNKQSTTLYPSEQQDFTLDTGKAHHIRYYRIIVADGEEITVGELRAG